MKPVNPVALFGDLDAPIISFHGEFISRAQFWADVHAFSDKLPDSLYIINDCKNRYAFLVTFIAGIINNKISLFPSARTQLVFDQLYEKYADICCVSDYTDVDFNVTVIPFDFNALGKNAPFYGELQPINGEQVVLIAFTSGTTGTPVPYKKTWQGFLAEAKVAGMSLGLESGAVARCVATIPAQHMYGFIASIMMPLYYGITIEADCPFFPEDMGCILSDNTNLPSMLVTTPLQLRNCVLASTALKNLALILSSAATLDQEIAKSAESLYQISICEFYGSTETGAIAFRETNNTKLWKTFNEITVKDFHKKLLVTSSYFEKQIIHDYVSVISDREFYLEGRSSEVVKVSGKRTSLSELNRVLLSIRGVKDGTFYQSSLVAEGRLMLIVVTDELTKENILSDLRNKIDTAFIPRKIIFVDKLPRSESGKLPIESIKELV